jgi:Mg-chelatase subunit ChlD
VLVHPGAARQGGGERASEHVVVVVDLSGSAQHNRVATHGTQCVREAVRVADPLREDQAMTSTI